MQTFIWKDLESGEEGSGEGPRAKPEQHEKIASELEKLPLAAHGELTGQPSGLHQEN